MTKEWLETLCEEAIILINDGYTVGPAMEKAWDNNYDSIAASSIDFNLDIDEVRNLFWDEGFDLIESYEDAIVARYEN
jgi:hypothetical protein